MTYQVTQMQKQIDQQGEALLQVSSATVKNMFDIARLSEERRRGL